MSDIGRPTKVSLKEMRDLGKEILEKQEKEKFDRLFHLAIGTPFVEVKK